MVESVSFDPYNFLSFHEEVRPDRSQFFKHCHAGYEFLFLLEGKIDMLIERSVFRVNAGDLVVVRPNDYHMATLADPERYSRAVANADEAFLRARGLGGLANLAAELPSGCYSAGQNSFLAAHFRRSRALLSVLKGEDDRKNVALSLLFTLYGAMKLGDELPPSAAAKQAGPLTRRVLGIVEEELANADLSLDGIARRLFVSKSRMCAAFAEETGVGVMRYVREKRIALARALIDGGMPIGEAAEKCGYREYSTFYRAFRSVLKKSPSAARPSTRGLS